VKHPIRHTRTKATSHPARRSKKTQFSGTPTNHAQTFHPHQRRAGSVRNVCATPVRIPGLQHPVSIVTPCRSQVKVDPTTPGHNSPAHVGTGVTGASTGDFGVREALGSTCHNLRGHGCTCGQGRAGVRQSEGKRLAGREMLARLRHCCKSLPSTRPTIEATDHSPPALPDHHPGPTDQTYPTQRDFTRCTYPGRGNLACRRDSGIRRCSYVVARTGRSTWPCRYLCCLARPFFG